MTLCGNITGVRELATSGPNLPPKEHSAAGFTLVETLIALIVLTFGLLAAGQLIFAAMGSASLSRSKGNAAAAAQGKLAVLADAFARDPKCAELTLGMHGPEHLEVMDRTSGRVLNRFGISWDVSEVPDPRPGKVIKARQVLITVSPVDDAGNPHFVPSLNKAVMIASVLGMRPL